MKEEVVSTIRPIRGFVNIDIRELWQYRELLFIFTWRDLKVRYKQTFLGALWAIVPPVMTMIVFSAFFGGFASMPSDGVPYPIFVFTGLLIWNYFSSALTNSSNSMINHQAMIQKIYFPRLIIPFSSIMAGLVDFGIASTVLLVLMAYYNICPGLVGILLIPVLLFITILASLGMGLIFSAINVKYRDVRYVLPFVIQLGLFVTPVIYPLSMVEGKWQFILWLNPMTSVIENARAALLGTDDVQWWLLVFSFFVSLLLFVTGIFYFRRVEKDFADII